MSTADISLFELAERRLAWATNRQQALAANVANANTPGYRPKDVAPFSVTLAAVAGAKSLDRTAPAHIGTSPVWMSALQEPRPQERAPDGNAVSLEDQLTKVADTANVQELVTNLYRKYQSMFRMVVGRGGS